MNEAISPAVNVTALPGWFEPARRLAFPAGATLADIVDMAGLEPWLRQTCDVEINGCPVPRAHWRLVKPKPGTLDRPVVVAIYPPLLHGGNQGGTKQILTIVATLALVAGTAFIGAGALVPVLGGWAGTALGSNALGSPFGVPGTLKLSVLPC